MNDEPTNTSDTNGKETDKNVETTPTTTPLIDIANQAAKRMEDANVETARLQKVQADRDAVIALGGTAGGHIEAPVVDEKTQKAEDAAKYFEGTQLEKDIKKANE